MKQQQETTSPLPDASMTVSADARDLARRIVKKVGDAEGAGRSVDVDEIARMIEGGRRRAAIECMTREEVLMEGLL